MTRTSLGNQQSRSIGAVGPALDQQVMARLGSIAEMALQDYQRREKRLTSILLPLVLGGAMAAAELPSGAENAASLMLVVAVLLYLGCQMRLSKLGSSALNMMSAGRLEGIRIWLRRRSAMLLATAIAGAIRFLVLIQRWDISAAELFTLTAVCAFGGASLFYFVDRSAIASRQPTPKLASIAVLYRAQELRRCIAFGTVAAPEAEASMQEELSRRQNHHLAQTFQRITWRGGGLPSQTGRESSCPADYAPHLQDTSSERAQVQLTERERLKLYVRWGATRGFWVGLGLAAWIGFQIALSSGHFLEEAGLSAPASIALGFLAGFLSLFLVGLLGKWHGGKIRNGLIGVVAMLVGSLFLFMAYTGSVVHWHGLMWQIWAAVSLGVGFLVGSAYRPEDHELP